MISSILAIVGPILAAIGAALLAYDAFQGPAHAHKQRMYKNYAAAHNDIYKYLITTYPSPPFNDEEVEKAKAQELKKRDEMIYKLQEEQSSAEMRHRLLVASLASWGFVLVAVGSLAQAISAVLS